MTHDRSNRLPFHLRFEPTHIAASTVRQEARRLLDECGVPAGVAADVELIISELAANAVEQQPETPVRLDMTVRHDSVQVSVVNQVTGAERPMPAGPTAEAAGDDDLVERGWGLAIVERLSDDMDFEIDDGWTSVRAVVNYGTEDQ